LGEPSSFGQRHPVRAEPFAAVKLIY
jgi:hypothetical protein